MTGVSPQLQCDDRNKMLDMEAKYLLSRALPQNLERDALDVSSDSEASSCSPFSIMEAEAASDEPADAPVGL